jgi:hypothetical protein
MPLRHRHVAAADRTSGQSARGLDRPPDPSARTAAARLADREGKAGTWSRGAETGIRKAANAVTTAYVRSSHPQQGGRIGDAARTLRTRFS